ncbi:hypothetical protein ACJJTC_001620 [Scirpophaga incertulas]
MCSNTYSATKPPVQAVSELSMPQQSEYETVSLAKNLSPIDNSSRELCANVNKSFVETVRTGDWKTESLNDEWIKVQRRKHRNRPVDADRVRGVITIQLKAYLELRVYTNRSSFKYITPQKTLTPINVFEGNLRCT